MLNQKETVNLHATSHIQNRNVVGTQRNWYRNDQLLQERNWKDSVLIDEKEYHRDGSIY